MRRIEALTGEAALRHVQETEDLLQEAARALKRPRKEMPVQNRKTENRLKDGTTR